VLTFVAAIGIVLFIWRELSVDNAVVDLRILKDRDLALGLVTQFVLGVGLYASVFIFPIFVQNLLGFSSLQTGLLLFPGGIATVIMMPVVGLLLKNRFPPQILATLGFILFFVFTHMLSKSTLESGQEDFFWPLILRGVCLSLLFVPLTSMALGGLEGKAIGQGAGLNNMMRQLGGSFGIAIITTFVNHRVAFHRNHLIENISQLNPISEERMQLLWRGFMQRGIDSMTAQDMAVRSMDGIITRQSYLLAYMDAFYIVGVVMLCALPIVYLHKYRKEVRLPMDAH
jgi:DHA2 family multidrug resistance protein